MDQTFLKGWEENRAMGRARFVLVHGVLGWGLLMAVAMSVVNHFTHEVGGWARIAANFVAFPLGGILFGLWSWCSSEKRYRNLMGRLGSVVDRPGA